MDEGHDHRAAEFRSVESRGFDIVYDRVGSGPGLVLFPGIFIALPDDVKAQMEARNDPRAAGAADNGLVEDVDRGALDCPAMAHVGGGEWFADVVKDEAFTLGARLEIIGDLDHAATFQATDTVVPPVVEFLSPR